MLFVKLPALGKSGVNSKITVAPEPVALSGFPWIRIPDRGASDIAILKRRWISEILWHPCATNVLSSLNWSSLKQPTYLRPVRRPIGAVKDSERKAARPPGKSRQLPPSDYFVQNLSVGGQQCTSSAKRKVRNPIACDKVSRIEVRHSVVIVRPPGADDWAGNAAAAELAGALGI
jgi:hypothetical protein